MRRNWKKHNTCDMVGQFTQSVEGGKLGKRYWEML